MIRRVTGAGAQVQGGNASLDQLWGGNVTDKLPDFSSYLTREGASAQQDGSGLANVIFFACLNGSDAFDWLPRTAVLSAFNFASFVLVQSFGC